MHENTCFNVVSTLLDNCDVGHLATRAAKQLICWCYQGHYEQIREERSRPGDNRGNSDIRA